MSLAIRGERFLQNFLDQQAKNRARRAKMDPKINTFGQVDIRVLALFGGRKSRFLDFLKVVFEFFRKYLGIVFELKRPTFGCIFN